VTAVVQLEFAFEPPLRGLQSGDGGSMAVTRAEVTLQAGQQAPAAVLRGFGLKSDGSVGGSKRVAALDPAGAWEAIPEEVRTQLMRTASDEALELAAHLE